MLGIERIENTLCMGCSTCKSVCPVGAIELNRNGSGYYIPVVDKSKCCNCGTCDTSCPVLIKYPKCYAVWADKETRLASSSGGAFSVIAKYVLDRGGVVFGAAWTEDIFVKHRYIESYEDIDILRRSKYAQSDVGDSFSQVKEFLEVGREVLFVGTPCQVAGLNSFLEYKAVNKSKLLTADFICYYNPSIYYIRKYLYDNYGLNNIASVDFRIKDFGWISSVLHIKFKNGTEKKISDPKDPYFHAYFNGYYNRDACKNCSFYELPHKADLTLGDFWKIEQHDPSWNDNVGTSMLMTNNVKGESIFKKIRGRFERHQEFPLSAIRDGQRNCNFEVKNQKYFKYLIGIKKFNEAVGMAKNSVYDVGMVCVLNYKNYGSAFTNYALYHVITKMQRSVYIITQPADSDTKPGGKQNFELFKYPDYALAPTFDNVAAMSELNKHCKQFLVGSDQLFNYMIYKNISGFIKLNWVDDKHSKAVYAASFGREKIFGSAEEIKDLKRCMERFSYFSTREESTVEMIKSNFGIDAKFVLDPIFLLENSHYEQLVSKLDKKLNGGIFVYILDPLQSTADTIRKVAEVVNMPVTAVSDMWRTKENIESLWDLDTDTGYSNERWIERIMNSELLITDSFHAASFAIKFNKPFLVIPNKLRGETRVKSIMGTVGICDRIYSEEMVLSKEHLLQGIDFVEVNERLGGLVTEGREYLKKILNII